MVLTMCGCLLLFCSGLAVLLFCWLSFTCLLRDRVGRSTDIEEPEATAD
jgi:hypothetical protein